MNKSKNIFMFRSYCKKNASLTHPPMHTHTNFLVLQIQLLYASGEHKQQSAGSTCQVKLTHIYIKNE